ncbi:hypothetical protein A0H81_05721 [Grifola frondosa]|uniref:Uncharacterized protein n=1 Tax=Grifola frondosa TaxID=5627 RepID=A0A1C7MDG4_GRIFR|nr:hypothetical protein A0H81_05721 [Grifola frondosa]
MSKPTPDVAPLALPAPSESDHTHELNVSNGESFKFDAPGPIVVNSDGTLSRIANWPNMTPLERKRTVRVLAIRNQIRLSDREKRQLEGDGQAWQDPEVKLSIFGTTP